uniref:Uncharacterized protein n=1 Tax=Brassica oleracea TaxID=3712 RepID=A0A3P6DKK4_BRAOL|nr:unnamed protein product [Brassica oleracea]
MQLGLKWASHGSSLRQPVHRRNRSLQPPPFPANLADIHRSSRKKSKQSTDSVGRRVHLWYPVPERNGGVSTAPYTRRRSGGLAQWARRHQV